MERGFTAKDAKHAKSAKKSARKGKTVRLLFLGVLCDLGALGGQKKA